LSVHVRDARLTDLPVLIAMKKQMAAAENAEGYFNDIAAHWECDFFGAAPRFLALIAECAGQPVGMAVFNEQPIAGWPKPPIYIQSIFVQPEYRRQGIGHALTAAITAEALRRHSHLIFLHVHQDNAARRMYEKGGFAHADGCLTYTLVLPQYLGSIGEAGAPAKE
jgi:GNAT superfamily N-acetyltransferase